MEKLVNSNDSKAVRNMNNIIGLHDVMINQRNPEEAIANFLDPNYIQHDPLVETGAAGLLKFFKQVVKDHPTASWTCQRIIAVDDFVWVHSNFKNIFTDDPNDTGIAGADIFKMNDEGKAIEHWEVLQLVGTPDNAAPWVAPNLKAANTNGIF
ncbi:nuclear transport factor 2 family protein [Flavobacterium undicola]|uniref:nuclear transport factor 2 family protein n=1 Tax=Flavobacterium undicola TaxID=1932779 RepID=UPI001376676A|nr:nuclear transport factor 2 family protein [Flavobacterium undicola]MBA0885038.1 nuclear transport factor 2 family protein [Flavobacterium undicola]